MTFWILPCEREPLVKIVWRWLRFLVAISAALLVGVGVWIGWLLSGQRYQQLLTEQLSALFGAELRVERSHLSFHGGFGVQFENVTVNQGAKASPFFTAAGIELLLDLTALWRGELLVRRIDLLQPSLQIGSGNNDFLQLVRRLREARMAAGESSHWLTRGVTPTLAVHDLRLHDATLAYAKASGSSPLFFVHSDLILNFENKEKPSLHGRTTLKSNDEIIGQVAVQASVMSDLDWENLKQSEWAGKFEFSNMQLEQVGRLLGAEWPKTIFAFTGHIQGKGKGPVALTGSLHAQGFQVGDVILDDARILVTRGYWGGPSPRALLSTLIAEARLEQFRGTIGKNAAPIVVKGGRINLSEDTFSLSELSGEYGSNSQFSDARVSFGKLSGKNGPTLEGQISASLSLSDDLLQLLTALTPTRSAVVAPFIAEPQGRAVVQFHVLRESRKSEPQYHGSITLQQVGGLLLPWNLKLDEMSGALQLRENALSFSALAFKIGQSQLNAQGLVREIFSARRSADLTLAFTEVRDHDVAPFLPLGKVLPQNGSLDGQLKMTVAAGGELSDVAGQLLLKRIRLDLVDFLHPFDIIDGELNLVGKGGSFVVKQGQFPGGVFSGHGRIIAWDPLRLELSGDFPDLDLAAALALDKPDDGLPKDAARDVRADLTSRRLTYQGTQIEGLQLFCHWHSRQADLRITQAKVASGDLKGEVTLWPDFDAAFLMPRLESMDVEQFFQTVGISAKTLTGKLSGGGKIYMTDWAKWDDLALWNASLSLSVEDGVAQRLPILVRLWSVLSMQGLLRLQLPSLPTEGLPFSSLTGDFALGKGIALTQNLSLSGNSVKLEASGQIDLAQRRLDLKTALAPLHGITSSVAKVPVAGELLAKGADYLTTLNFRVSGPYADPSVTPLLIDTNESYGN